MASMKAKAAKELKLLSIRVRPEIIVEAKIKALREGCPLQELVERALIQYTKQPLKEKG